jgi:hypothetical protein
MSAINCLLYLAFAAVSTVRADTPSALTQLTCDSTTTGGDIRNFSCALALSKKAQSFRFKANFSGGHDDTTASMTLAVNDAPLVCDQGSKTSLMAEDGDVSLECKFSIAGKQRDNPILQVELKWSHAQYMDFELRAE